jgi:hypothetical protein
VYSRQMGLGLLAYLAEGQLWILDRHEAVRGGSGFGVLSWGGGQGQPTDVGEDDCRCLDR